MPSRAESAYPPGSVDRKGTVIEFNPRMFRRIAQGFGRIRFRQRSDVRETEQPLGIGLRFADEAGQDGQTRADQDKRQLDLLQLVHVHDEGAEFLAAEILDLVDEQRQGRLPLLCRFGYREEQVRQIALR